MTFETGSWYLPSPSRLTYVFNRVTMTTDPKLAGRSLPNDYMQGVTGWDTGLFQQTATWT